MSVGADGWPIGEKRYPSDSKEKAHEYYENWRAKKLAADPDFFKHEHQRKVAVYGRDYHNKKSKEWHERNPNYYAEYRLKHPNYNAKNIRKFRATHKKEHNEEQKLWIKAHPEMVKVYYAANKIPLAPYCEVCPEDDLHKSTQRHHPDYSYPQIFVSCCNMCHTYMNKERGNNTIMEEKKQ